MESGNEKTSMQSLLDRIAGLEERVSRSDQSERFRLLVEAAPNGIILSNEEGEILMVNRRAEEMFGYDRDTFATKRIEDLVPTRFRCNHEDLRLGFYREPEIRTMGAGRELYALRSDGTEFPVEIGLTPVRENGGVLVVSAVLDITARKEAYATLQFQSEILRNVHDAVFYVRPDGTILDWNEGAERVFGIPRERAVGGNLSHFLTEGSESGFSDRIFPVVDRTGKVERVLRCFLTNGRDLFIRVKGTKLRQNGKDGYVICASDITEQKLLESKIVSISENEQRRIGQDIHDDLCSQLSGIACITKALEAEFVRNERSEAEMMARISSMVADAVSKARQIAKGLVPAALENQGLRGALDELVRRNSEIFKMNCRITRCDVGASEGLSPAIGAQLYRIAQEAVTNAMKHSQAANIEVSLTLSGDEEIELKISDDGKGMPNDLVSQGLGLLTMQQRAEMIGAELDIRSVTNRGTTIRCSLVKPIEIHE